MSTVKEVKQLNLHQRIAVFQTEKIDIQKSKKAHGYKYAPLDVILPIINPYLIKHGIGYSHVVEYDKEINKHFLRTTFFSVDCVTDVIVNTTYINEAVKLPNQNEFMVLGSAITYFRRYHVVTTLALTTDEDTDAGGAIPDKNKTTGRSVESAGMKEGQVNYVSIFKNLIDKKKTQDQVQKTFEMHKPKMSEEEITQITSLITESYEKK
jgi:hypothetical protein